MASFSNNVTQKIGSTIEMTFSASLGGGAVSSAQYTVPDGSTFHLVAWGSAGGNTGGLIARSKTNGWNLPYMGITGNQPIAGQNAIGNATAISATWLQGMTGAGDRGGTSGGYFNPPIVFPGGTTLHISSGFGGTNTVTLRIYGYLTTNTP